MKIAIPTKGSMVDDHFGHCDHYSIVSVTAENEIDKIEILLMRLIKNSKYFDFIEC